MGRIISCFWDRDVNPFLGVSAVFLSMDALDSRILFVGSSYLPNANIANDHFYLAVSGFDKPFYRLLEMFDETNACFIVVILIAVFAFISCQARVKRFLNGLKIFFFVFFGFILWRYHGFFTIMDAFKSLPVWVMLFAVSLNRSFIKTKTASPQMVGLSVFACFSLLLLVKILLNVTLYGYGFVLALPSVLLLVVILLQFLPKLIDGLFNGTENFVSSSFLVLIGVVICVFVSSSSLIYSSKNFRIVRGKDEVVSFDPPMYEGGLQFQQALNFVNSHLNSKGTFLVLPQGALLNYLSRKDTGTYYFKLAAAEKDMWTKKDIVQDLERHPPDYILQMSLRDLEKDFGKDSIMSFEIPRWVHANYRQVKSIGGMNQPDLIIFKRK